MPITGVPAACTNSCLKRGITLCAVEPTPVGSVGRSRHAMTSRPSSAASASTVFMACASASSSSGRKAVPTA